MPKEQPPEGWEWVPLSSVARLESGHTPSRKHPEYWGGKIPWIGIRDATSNHGRTIYRTEQTTNSLGIENSSARVLPANTVCLSRTASVGYVVVMGVPMATSQDFINWVCSEAIDYSYLKYVLFAEHDSMLRFASGTTHQTIYFPEAKAFHVCLPPIAVQRRIVDSLQTLDDRIALLRETNATLEAIAQALFKSWFVDFDPVHANAGGEQPAGLPPEVAALFPDSFEESALGMIPRGWDVGVLGDVAETSRKQIKPEQLSAETLYVGLEHIPRKQLGLDSWGTAGELASAKSAFERNDILFGKLRPYFHKVVIAPFEGVCSTDILVCKAKQTAYHHYVAMHLFSDELIAYADRLSNGAKMPRINWKDLAAYEVAIPPSEVAEQFYILIEPMIARMLANVEQAQTLANLRDTLLPRLISGQLRLPDTEQQLKDLAV
ncbi:restriction endonuclease subunit S [Aeromonas veronii]|uniref:restriction endonuclease subunit S n=1 Tax=Aeromonas veronii TaxID=654 RepID=UPI001F1BCBEC|nr:restriction endonuclease subunit S [Aeromonas veronii]